MCVALGSRRSFGLTPDTGPLTCSKASVATTTVASGIRSAFLARACSFTQNASGSRARLPRIERTVGQIVDRGTAGKPRLELLQHGVGERERLRTLRSDDANAGKALGPGGRGRRAFGQHPPYPDGACGDDAHRVRLEVTYGGAEAWPGHGSIVRRRCRRVEHVEDRGACERGGDLALGRQPSFDRADRRGGRTVHQAPACRPRPRIARATEGRRLRTARRERCCRRPVGSCATLSGTLRG